jgi:hypothetical protein
MLTVVVLVDFGLGSSRTIFPLISEDAKVSVFAILSKKAEL